MARRRTKSKGEGGWPAGAVAAAAVLLAVGPAVRVGLGGDLATAAVALGVAFVLAPLVVLASRRLVGEELRPGRDLPRLALVLLVAAAVYVAASAALGVLVAGGAWSSAAWAELIRSTLGARAGAFLLPAAGLVLFDRLLDLARRARALGVDLAETEDRATALAARGTEVARRLRDESDRRNRFEKIHQHARLEALRARLRPGFLLGVVDGARAAAKDDPPRAERMLLRLSLILRTALREGEADLVPLSEEIERTDAVLDLERDRLGRRLKYRVDVPEELLDDLVPALLLTPLVLRAVANGPASTARGGEVEVRASCEGGRLRLEIQDDVSAIVRAEEARKDPELAALGERLKILYGRGAKVASGARVEGGTRLVIEVPRVAGVAKEAS